MANPFSGGELGLLGLQGLQGLFQGLGQSSANKQSKKDVAQSRKDSVRNQQLQFEQGKLDRGRQDARDFADRTDMGDEQAYVQRNNILRAILPGLAAGSNARPQDPAIAALIPQSQNPLAGLLQGGQLRPDIAASFSDNATMRALTDNRNELAAINPNHVFRPLSDYGFSGPDVDIFNAETSQAGKLVGDQTREGYSAIQAILDQMNSEADADLKEASKGTPWWKQILGPAAGIAASFIPGVGPWLAPMIGAGVGGASNGVQGAILGGMSGGGAELLSKFMQKPPQGPQLNNQMSTQSVPLGYGGSGFGQLPGVQAGLLPSTPTGGFQGLAGSMAQNRPNLPSSSPQAPRTAGGGSPVPNPVLNAITGQDLALAGYQPGNPSSGFQLPRPQPGFSAADPEGWDVKGQAMIPPQLGVLGRIPQLVGLGRALPLSQLAGGASAGAATTAAPAIAGMAQKFAPPLPPQVGGMGRFAPPPTPPPAIGGMGFRPPAPPPAPGQFPPMQAPAPGIAQQAPLMALLQKLQSIGSAPNQNAAQAILQSIQGRLQAVPGQITQQLPPGVAGTMNLGASSTAGLAGQAQMPLGMVQGLEQLVAQLPNGAMRNAILRGGR